MSADHQDFDEEWYLHQNADVAAVVSRGGFPSGLHHYLAHGEAEGRSPLPPEGWVKEERQDAYHPSVPAGVHYPPPYSLELDETELLDALEKQVGMAPQELLRRFESLGNDCKFGFVQRRCGAEPLGVFRFSNPSAGVVVSERLMAFSLSPRISRMTAKTPDAIDPSTMSALRSRTTWPSHFAPPSRRW